jgi:hypothetical protein
MALTILLMLPGQVAGAEDLSRSTQQVIRAAQRAPQFLVPGNMPRSFRASKRHTVRPGTTAFVGQDARRRSIWVVDHRSVYQGSGQANITRKLMEGFFTGACAGGSCNGPRMRILAVQRGGTWHQPRPGDHTSQGAKRSPLTDPSVERFIVKVSGVRPVPNTSAVLHPASFQMVIERRSIKHGPNLAEFTGHFLNPDRQRGPFPGTTDGALRIRARRLADGRVSLEEYYVTRKATQFLDAFSTSVKPLATGSRLYQLGRNLMGRTVPGKVMGAFADQGAKMAKGMMDTTVKHTMGQEIWRQVARYHTSYWEDVMFRNLLRSR